MDHTVHTGRAQARLGLLGNPSDGYGGRVIATTIADFGATVTARVAARWTIGDGDGHGDGDGDGGGDGDGHGHCTESPAALLDDVGDAAGGATLIAAALAVAARDESKLVDGRPLALTFETSVPREVGLAGSSAIVTATLRALAAARRVRPAPAAVARLALDAEVEMLGWAAGPQDRIAQAHGGALDMDFAQGWDPGAWHRLDPASLPPLVLAWDTRTAASSDIVHRDVRARWQAGDAEVVGGMRRFAAIAAEGSDALAAGDAAIRWPDLLDESYELRRRFWHLTDRDEALVEIARAHGIGASLAGSGGAIVGVARRPDGVGAFVAAVRASGADAIVPTIGPGEDVSP